MQPILFEIFGIKIYSYGVMVATGFLLALWLGIVRAKKAGIKASHIIDLSFYVLLAGIFGAKIILFLNRPGYYIRSFKSFWSLMRSGGVIIGGLVMAMIVAAIYLRKHKLDTLKVLDIAAPSIALGQAVGRIGCFLAGCCYGKVCQLPWAVTFTNPVSHENVGTPLNISLHPVQLYSSLTNWFIFIFLTWYYPKRKYKGQVFLLYVLLYSITRFINEFFRGDLSRITIGGPLSDAQYLGIVGAAVSIYFLIKKKKENNN
jgi:phosphatidylglycerol:prolipoprotein diacylglycerol transferase